MKYFTKKHIQHIREELSAEQFMKKFQIEFLQDEIYFDVVYNYPGVGYINRCFTSVPGVYTYEVVLQGMSPEFENLEEAEKVLLEIIIGSKRFLIENIKFKESLKSPAQDLKLCNNNMPTLNKTFSLTVTPEQFLAACSDLEIQELDLLLGTELRRRKLYPDHPDDEINDQGRLPEKTS